jgi:hypothetical protein
MKKLIILFAIVSAAACGSQSSSDKMKGGSPDKNKPDSLRMPADTLKARVDTSRAIDSSK